MLVNSSKYFRSTYDSLRVEGFCDQFRLVMMNWHLLGDKKFQQVIFCSAFTVIYMCNIIGNLEATVCYILDDMIYFVFSGGLNDNIVV